MDLLSEGSSSSRVLSVRHISVDKAFPKTDNGTRTALLCHSYSPQPDFGSYVAALHPYEWVVWSCGLLVLALICLLYVLTLRSARAHWRGSWSTVAVVLLVYPIVAASAFIVLVVPRSRVLSEALAQCVVMVAMYNFFCLVIKECGGPDQLTRRASASRIETRVLPCCCWPCCIIPRPKIQKRSLQWLRCLILQMPVMQNLIYVVLLILWSESMHLYHSSFVYFQPFIAVSILSGVWGVIMSVRMAEEAGHRPKKRFLALQLVLIIVKLQCGGAKFLSEIISLPCTVSRLHPSVMVHLLQNCLMMVEMLLLSLWAWRLYGAPPEKDIKVQHVMVAVLEDGNVGGLNLKVPKDGIENKCFN